jgi:hypothetical protein
MPISVKDSSHNMQPQAGTDHGRVLEGSACLEALSCLLIRQD